MKRRRRQKHKAKQNDATSCPKPPQKKKVCFYIAQYPVRWTAQSASHFSSPGRPVHSDTVLGYSWKHSSYAAITQRLFTDMSTTVYSQVLIYTAESTEASWRERKCPNFEKVAKGIWTRALSIASPAFYHWAIALHKHRTTCNAYTADNINIILNVYIFTYDNVYIRLDNKCKNHPNVSHLNTMITVSKHSNFTCVRIKMQKFSRSKYIQQAAKLTTGHSNNINNHAI